MKKLLIFILLPLFLNTLTLCVSADETEDYKSQIYSGIQKIELPKEAYDLGIDYTDPESVLEVDHRSALNYIFSVVKSSISAPLKVLLVVLALSLVSQIITSLTDNPENYEVIMVIACFISISSTVINSISNMTGAINSIQGFMAAYVPIFASIAIASGNISGALSYNAIVLYTCEAATLFATIILKPILICIAVLSVTQAINSEMPDFASSLRKSLVALIGLLMTIFTGVIGLHATVGRATDGIGLRAGKYLVSSFVPILGYTITQSYQTIKSSLSMIRSTIGVFGIIVTAVIFLLPIISLWMYRCCFTLCEWTAALCQSKRIASLMKGLGDVYLLMSVILLMYFIMLIVSTGMLIALGGSV
ncbi:MAG: hypothetical protein IJ424_03815 [Oscillospiraceae bacterium]|nr:hypothetical protein [Oscillospiraceae bacterium]